MLVLQKFSTLALSLKKKGEGNGLVVGVEIMHHIQSKTWLSDLTFLNGDCKMVLLILHPMKAHHE